MLVDQLSGGSGGNSDLVEIEYDSADIAPSSWGSESNLFSLDLGWEKLPRNQIGKNRINVNL